MINIFRVFLSDVKRLSSNVVAIVIIMGLSIIPALYAWFNIMSNWDVYGEAATSQMHIAVYSCDEGVTMGSLSVNVGDTVKSGLESNKTIGWVFTDTEMEAMQGVYNGEYYAAFIIPEDFTQDMLSFLNGDPDKHPTIDYYENSKKNAIATKITSKVKTAVQQQVNTSILSTLTESASSAGELIAGSSENIADGAVTKLEDIEKNLGTYANLLNTLSLLTSSAADLVDTSQGMLPSVEGLIEGSQGTVSSMQQSVLSGAQTTQAVKSMIDVSLTNINNQLATVEQTIQNFTIDTSFADQLKGFEQLSGIVYGTLDSLDALGVDTGTLRTQYEELQNTINGFETNTDMTEEKLNSLKETAASCITAVRSSITSLQSNFDLSITPSIDNSVYNIENSLIEAQNMLSSIDDSFPQIDLALENYQSLLESGTDDISATRDYVIDLQNGVSDLIDSINELVENEQYKEVMELLQTNPEIIASFISSPIQMDEVAFYEIAHYGSAMSPFYTVLALWVGGLITVAIVHTKVVDTDDLKGVKNYQKFFGRYIVFFLIGQAQTLITVLGDLFYVQIDCAHPFLFWVASAVTSCMFTFFMYALTYSFGNVGEAIAVVIMVIQVAGAGGTFPVEVLPDVYQAIYKFLPFTYAMNGLRECVGGFYGNYLAQDLGVLGCYILISIGIGALRKPFAKLNHMIEMSKEKSGLLI